MHSASTVALAYLAAYASAHGVVTKVTGANGVEMPGLTVADGTPRDCSSNRCGSQADTAIMRDREISSGRVGPLGRTQGNGPVDAATMINAFMGEGAAPTNNGTGVGEEDNIPATATGGEAKTAKGKANKANRRQFNLGGLLGGGAAGGADKGAAGGGLAGLLGGGAGAGAGAGADDDAEAGAAKGKKSTAGGGLAGLLGGGAGADAGTKNTPEPESMVAATAGNGASEGLPTCADDGSVTMTFRQINQDGAGPMEAMIDGTSGGTEMAAFQTAEVTQDVPGLGFQGLSLATTTDFPMTVQMPAGMTCDATVGAAENVCVVRVRNEAGAGPFGGAAAFTQSPAARKRALEYRRKMRRSTKFTA